jgi:tRNA pseudouridine32 synthase/23S rRNA pseudouridine746 synthase
MRVGSGANNSLSLIRCSGQHGDRALFELQPVSGKTHQLRVHMQSIGLPILNDPLYPVLLAERPNDFTQPLLLLAKRLSFIDPVTEQTRDFHCPDSLSLVPGVIDGC